MGEHKRNADRDRLIRQMWDARHRAKEIVTAVRNCWPNIRISIWIVYRVAGMRIFARRAGESPSTNPSDDKPSENNKPASF